MDKKVLLVADDDDMNRKIIGRFLKNDFDILEASDGKATIDILRNNHVDALLLDIIMPEIDGLEVLKIMKADETFHNIGVLVATSTKEQTERLALSIGADDIVSKPYDPIVIKKRIENIMAMKEASEYKNKDYENVSEKIDEYKRQLCNKIEGILTSIANDANVIVSNLDNDKLINELAGNIIDDTDRIIEELN